MAERLIREFCDLSYTEARHTSSRKVTCIASENFTNTKKQSMLDSSFLRMALSLTGKMRLANVK